MQCAPTGPFVPLLGQRYKGRLSRDETTSQWIVTIFNSDDTKVPLILASNGQGPVGPIVWVQLHLDGWYISPW